MSESFEKFISAVRRVVERERQVLVRPDLKAAAVLIPIVRRDSRPSIVLTKRTMTLASHKGQISFPGGVAETVDNGPTDTALREAHEEIGLQSSLVRVFGLLSDMETSSGYVVSPVVGLVSSVDNLSADPAEVAEIFEAPLSMFRDPAYREERILEHRGVKYHDVRYDILGHEVWGATSRIITDFMAALEAEGAF